MSLVLQKHLLLNEKKYVGMPRAEKKKNENKGIFSSIACSLCHRNK